MISFRFIGVYAKMYTYMYIHIRDKSALVETISLYISIKICILFLQHNRLIATQISSSLRRNLAETISTLLKETYSQSRHVYIMYIYTYIYIYTFRIHVYIYT